jgi:hypothetical protein
LLRRREMTRSARSGRWPNYSITSSARASSGRRHSEAERFGGLEVDEEEAAISQLPELMLLLPNAATSLEI